MLMMLMYGFSKLPAHIGFILVVCGLLGLATFVWWELRVEHPILNIMLFKQNRVFAFSNLALGYLMIRSNNLPTLLGLGLQAAATVYLVGAYTRFVMPEYLAAIEPIYLVPFITEFSFCVWLLFTQANARMAVDNA